MPICTSLVFLFAWVCTLNTSIRNIALLLWLISEMLRFPSHFLIHGLFGNWYEIRPCLTLRSFPFFRTKLQSFVTNSTIHVHCVLCTCTHYMYMYMSPPILNNYMYMYNVCWYSYYTGYLVTRNSLDRLLHCTSQHQWLFYIIWIAYTNCYVILWLIIIVPYL